MRDFLSVTPALPRSLPPHLVVSSYTHAHPYSHAYKIPFSLALIRKLANHACAQIPPEEYLAKSECGCESGREYENNNENPLRAPYVRGRICKLCLLFLCV